MLLLNSLGGTTTQDLDQYVIFTLDTRTFGLRLSQVERVIYVTDITPLPKAPEIILGVINLAGEIIPVVDVRKRFHIPSREILLSDRFIVVYTSKRKAAMLVDSVTGVIESPPAKVIGSQEILPSMEYVSGVIKLNDDLALIHDLEAFLSLEEEQALDSAISDYRGAP